MLRAGRGPGDGDGASGGQRLSWGFAGCVCVKVSPLRLFFFPPGMLALTVLLSDSCLSCLWLSGYKWTLMCVLISLAEVLLPEPEGEPGLEV